jgi:hypothetical protein
MTGGAAIHEFHVDLKVTRLTGKLEAGGRHRCHESQGDQSSARDVLLVVGLGVVAVILWIADIFANSHWR